MARGRVLRPLPRETRWALRTQAFAREPGWGLGTSVKDFLSSLSLGRDGPLWVGRQPSPSPAAHGSSSVCVQRPLPDR